MSFTHPGQIVVKQRCYCEQRSLVDRFKVTCSCGISLFMLLHFIIFFPLIDHLSSIPLLAFHVTELLVNETQARCKGCQIKLSLSSWKVTQYCLWPWLNIYAGSVILHFYYRLILIKLCKYIQQSGGLLLGKKGSLLCWSDSRFQSLPWSLKVKECPRAPSQVEPTHTNSQSSFAN